MLTTGKKFMNTVPPIPPTIKKGKVTRTTRKRSEKISENKERMDISVHDDLIGGIRKKKRKTREMDMELEKEEKEEDDLQFDQRMKDLISSSSHSYHHQEEREGESDYEESIMNLSSTSSEKKKVDPNLNDHQYKRVFFDLEQKFIMFLNQFIYSLCF